MNSKIVALLIVSLFAFPLFISTNTEASQPIGVAGYIYDENGHPIPNWQVNITNVNTSVTKTITTNALGMYAVSIEANDGDILQGNFSYNGKLGFKQRTADLTLLTNWLNITLSTKQPPVANFVYSPLNPSSSSIIQFTDLSYDTDGHISFWSWSFGDGTVSSQRNPIHIYGREGRFKIILMVRDDDGLYSSTFRYITVSDTSNNTKNNTIIIPPLPTPINPYQPYTVPEMYKMLRIDRIGHTDGSVSVAVIDTGVTQREYEGYNMYQIKPLSIPSLIDPYDNNGHGTWCNWAVFYGVSGFTNGEQYSIRVINENSCSYDEFLKALDMAKKLKVDVVSISLGGMGSVKGEIAKKVDELRHDGIIVVCAGGNYGPTPSTIITPALSPSAIAVGAVNPENTIEFLGDDQVCVWSSRGQVPHLKENKPDVTAGGESIIGAWLYGERVVSGTSMATPVVAGGCSVVYAKHEKLWDFLKGEYSILTIGNLLGGKRIVPFIFEYSMEKTAYHQTGWDDTSYGHGIPQFDKMSRYALGLGIMFALLPFIIIGSLFGVFYRIHRKYGIRAYFSKYFGNSTKKVRHKENGSAIIEKYL